MVTEEIILALIVIGDRFGIILFMKLTAGGSIRKIAKNPIRVFTSFKGSFDDQYFRRPANQVVSSLYPNTAWSPSQDNRWAGMLKLDYEFNPRMRLSFTYLRSITINQDLNMLRIIGNDAPFLQDSNIISRCSPTMRIPIPTIPIWRL